MGYIPIIYEHSKHLQRVMAICETRQDADTASLIYDYDDVDDDVL